MYDAPGLELPSVFRNLNRHGLVRLMYPLTDVLGRLRAKLNKRYLKIRFYVINYQYQFNAVLLNISMIKLVNSKQLQKTHFMTNKSSKILQRNFLIRVFYTF